MISIFSNLRKKGIGVLLPVISFLIWLDGVELLAVYIILGLAFLLLPE